MEFLSQLWLPILVSAGLVFVASFLSWMILPFHRKEYAQVKDQDALLEGVRGLALRPGKYMFPSYDSKEDCKSPEFQARWKAGPHGVLHLFSRQPAFGRNLAWTFVFYLVVGVFVAYLTHMALRDRTAVAYLDVFQISGTAAILAYVFGWIPNAIWFQKSAVGFVADLVDGIVYGLLTAGTFAWLYPA